MGREGEGGVRLINFHPLKKGALSRGEAYLRWGGGGLNRGFTVFRYLKVFQLKRAPISLFACFFNYFKIQFSLVNSLHNGEVLAVCKV